MKTAADVRDFVREQKELYLPGAEPSIIDVPEMKFLMIDGSGAPDPEQGDETHKSEFQEAFGALYGLIYSIKMSPKKGEALTGYYNFRVPPPEGLWWLEGREGWDMERRGDWRWTLMIRVPEYVTPEVVRHFAGLLTEKKQDYIYLRVRLESYDEGLSIQMMHTGTYASEGPDIERLHKFAVEQGYKLRGKHHETYFGDPRRTSPEKLRTVLRQPIDK